jgi:hypothetical protein
MTPNPKQPPMSTPLMKVETVRVEGIMSQGEYRQKKRAIKGSWI